MSFRMYPKASDFFNFSIHTIPIIKILSSFLHYHFSLKITNFP